MLPIFELLTPLDEVLVPGDLLEEAADENVVGATVSTYGIAEGQLILTVWNGCLHEVIYQTPRAAGEAQHRDEQLFIHYGGGHAWREILDNGFGKTYRRVDMERYALWSYAMDVATFGTMQFHAVKW